MPRSFVKTFLPMFGISINGIKTIHRNEVTEDMVKRIGKEATVVEVLRDMVVMVATVLNPARPLLLHLHPDLLEQRAQRPITTPKLLPTTAVRILMPLMEDIRITWHMWPITSNKQPHSRLVMLVLLLRPNVMLHRLHPVRHRVGSILSVFDDKA